MATDNYSATEAGQKALEKFNIAPVAEEEAEEQRRRDAALKKLIEQAGGTVEAFEKAGPLLQQKLRAGVGKAYQAARGAGGRGAGTSGGALQAIAAAQSGAEAEAASRMADYGVDLAAAQTDLNSFTLELLDSERRRTEQKYVDVMDQLQAAQAEFGIDQHGQLQYENYIQEQIEAAAAAGDQDLVDFLTNQLAKEGMTSDAFAGGTSTLERHGFTDPGASLVGASAKQYETEELGEPPEPGYKGGIPLSESPLDGCPPEYPDQGKYQGHPWCFPDDGGQQPPPGDDQGHGYGGQGDADWEEDIPDPGPDI